MRPPGQFDRVASGHYARIRRTPAPTPSDASLETAALQLTRDDIKDQTYFLAHLAQPQLSRCMFPLGPLTKPEVRAVAAALDLPNKARKDSQGICFLGKVKFPEFVKEHLGEWPGVFIDQDTGKLAGYHSGFWFYTVRYAFFLPTCFSFSCIHDEFYLGDWVRSQCTLFCSLTFIFLSNLSK